MNIFLDALILLILVIFVIGGIHKGLIRSAINLFGTLFSAYFSAFLGNTFAHSIYDSFIRQSILNSVSDSLESSVGQGVLSTADEIFENLPGFLKAISPHLADSSQLQNAVSSGIDSIAATVEQLVSPVIISIVSIALTVVLFILLSVLVRFISRAVSRVCRIPVLFGINRTLGGILGFLKGAVLIMLAVSLICLFTDFNTSYRQTIDNTTLFRFFYNYNIFSFIFR